MKTWAMVTIMLFWNIRPGWADILTFKDGRTVEGDLISHDQTKVVMKVDGIFLTYYNEDVASITQESLQYRHASDAQKEQLIDEYLQLFPSDMRALGAAEQNIPKDQRPWFLSYLRQNGVIPQLDKIRKRKMMEYFSVKSLRAAVIFFSSPEGRAYSEEIRRYYAAVNPEFTRAVNFMAHRAMTNKDATRR